MDKVNVLFLQIVGLDPVKSLICASALNAKDKRKTKRILNNPFNNAQNFKASWIHSKRPVKLL